MATMQERVDQAHKSLLSLMDRHPVLTLKEQLTVLENKCGYSRAWLLCGVGGSVALTLYLLGGLPLISRLVGFVYPAYSSFRTIDSPSPQDSELWLTYWIVFALVGILEPLLWPLLRLVPLYHVVKSAFLVWCYNPGARGATTIYSQLIRPYVLPRIGISGGAGGGSRGVPGGARNVMAAAAAAAAGTAVVEPDDLDGAEREVTVRVVGASGLPAMEAGDTHPYVQVFVQNAAGRTVSAKCKTKVAPSTRDPKWGEDMALRVRAEDAAAPGARAVAVVCHKTGFGQDLTVGLAAVPLASLAGGEPVHGEYTLTDDAKDNPAGVAGRVTLELRLQ